MKQMHFNRLSAEKSPYLLQHASNPVNWYSWCDEAFQHAEELDRPVFLSIGYATCHWCHVMERESFENEELAEYLNEHYICIKVDREERPDVDELYMKALHASGQHGGWPLNMFLTPDRKPIIGGTYFPPAPAFGKPSFRQVLESIYNFWTNERYKVLDSANSLTQFLKDRSPVTHAVTTDVSRMLNNIASDIMRSYDSTYGGFISNGQNKFPPSMQLLFLLQRYRINHEERLLEICENTVSAMKRGGIYDQIGGGLCRYSTDHYWLVPHFEKMLYDNALFARVLIDLYRITSKDFYREWALDLINYIRRDMKTKEGVFASAEDADSEGQEGKFYVWEYTEFINCLSEENFPDDEIRLFLKFWNVTKNGNFENKNILNEPVKRDVFLSENNLDPEQFEEILNRAKTALLKKRSGRIRPLQDDKILVSWNSMMISTLAQAGIVFGEQFLIDDALAAAVFITDKMKDGDGNLYRRYRDGDLRYEGQLSDHALLGAAYLDLYRATGKEYWMRQAKYCADKIIENFSGNGGGFFNTGVKSADLIVRSGDAYDGVEPSGNSAAARLFFMLMQYDIDALKYSEILQNMFVRFQAEIANMGQSHAHLAGVFNGFHSMQSTIVLIEGDDADNFEKISIWLKKNTAEDAAVCIQKKNGENESNGSSEYSGMIPLLRNKKALENLTTIYVCRNGTCEKPLHTLNELISATGHKNTY